MHAPKAYYLLGMVATTACAHHFVATNFATIYQPHVHAFAIAPIANLSTEPEGVKAGQAIREAIYYELAERRDQYTTSIQDIAETDRLIHQAGVSDSAAALLPAGELCKMLGVDAVMRGSVTKYKKHGAAAQIVTAALFGFAKGSDVKADVAIYDGGDGQLIYQHNIEKAGGLFSSPDGLRNSVGKTVAKAFPYKKQG
jgi:hypothetical protein